MKKHILFFTKPEVICNCAAVSYQTVESDAHQTRHRHTRHSRSQLSEFGECIRVESQRMAEFGVLEGLGEKQTSQKSHCKLRHATNTFCGNMATILPTGTGSMGQRQKMLSLLQTRQTSPTPEREAKSKVHWDFSLSPSVIPTLHRIYWFKKKKLLHVKCFLLLLLRYC